MKNKKGFAISSVVYSMLILFLGLILLILSNLASRKVMFDKEKNEILARFDSDTELLCTAKSKTTVTYGNLAYGNYNYGDEYSCDLGDGDAKTFYVLEENDNTVSLIMNMNVGSDGKGVSSSDGVMWCKSGEDNSCEGDGAKEYLNLSTKSWAKLNSGQITLPSVEQIANVTGQTFDGDKKIDNLPIWLYENLNESYSYHTSSAHQTYTNQAYGVYYDGSIGGEYVDQTHSNYYGVRPVITIFKSQIKNLDSIICTAKSTVTNGNLAYGDYNYGDEYSCDLGDGDVKTFYVLEENDNTVSLIMNMNVSSDGKGAVDSGGVMWCKSGEDNSCEGAGAKEYLSSSTKSWTKLNSNQISLPSVEQIATAAGKTFDGINKVTDLSKWLYENLNKLYSYHTLSAHQTYTNQAYGIYYDGSIGGEYVDQTNSNYYGVRPVITISKSQIKNLTILCTAKTVKTNGNLAYGDYNYGDEYSCSLGDYYPKTFYVLEENDDTVSLIMNMNIDNKGIGATSGNTVTWCKSGSNNSCAADSALEYLTLRTTRWRELNSDQISLPTYNQIYKAAGNIYSGLPNWLYENLPSPTAYWTSTSNSFNQAYVVYYSGNLYSYLVTNTFGLRPVITIPKTQIKNLNPTIICTAKTTKTNGNLATGNYNYGDEYSCDLGDGDAKTFYVLENSDKEVSLIMDSNIYVNGHATTDAGSGMKWCLSSSETTCEGDGALNYLTGIAGQYWTSIDSSQVSLPSTSQISNVKAGGVIPAWIYSNLNKTDPYGYWTSSSFGTYSVFVVNLNESEKIGYVLADTSSGIGVRPVITISKLNIQN